MFTVIRNMETLVNFLNLVACEKNLASLMHRIVRFLMIHMRL